MISKTPLLKQFKPPLLLLLSRVHHQELVVWARLHKRPEITKIGPLLILREGEELKWE
jgi:hypothetical protein